MVGRGKSVDSYYGKKSSDFGQRFIMTGNRSGHYGTERTAVHVRSWKTGHAAPTSISADHPLRQLLCSRRQRTHNSLSEGCLKRMRDETADANTSVLLNKPMRHTQTRAALSPSLYFCTHLK